MNNNKKLPGGLLILLGVCTAMIVLTILQVLLPGIGLFPVFIRTNVINILLGAAGMGALLYMGNRVSKKLHRLQELVGPLEKKDYQALASLKLQDSGEESYLELEKTLKNLGVFIEIFRTHANGNSVMEKRLKEIINSIKEGTGETAGSWQTASVSLAHCLGEIDSSAEQAVSALEQVESYFSSISETGRSQNNVMAELDASLSTTAELEQSMTETIKESEKNAGDLRSKINDGEGHSRNAYNIINEASKDLDKITEIVRTINKTSQQTNILSMNAAIESAHAGAAGAGFAVVADEIRKLAESNSANAKNIQTVLLGITRQITEALKASEVSSNAFNSLTDEINRLVESLAAVSGNARKSNDTRARMKMALLDVPGGTANNVHDKTVDTAAFVYSFRAALEHIKTLCKPEKTGITEAGLGGSAAGFPGADTRQPVKKLETDLDKILEYLKETEELEGILVSSGLAHSLVKKAAAARRPGGDAGRDVAVKSPPKVVY